jgi:hypothetical protein
VKSPSIPTPPKVPIGPHPSAEELLAASEATLRHAATCADCTTELARLQAFQNPEPLAPAALEAAWRRFEAGPPKASNAAPARHDERDASPWRRLLAALGGGSPRGRWSLGLATAAVAVLAAVIGLSVWQAQRAVPVGTPDPQPSGSEDTLRGELFGITPLAPRGDVASAPHEVRFQNPQAIEVRIQLVSALGEVVWTSEQTTASMVVIPEDRRALLKAPAEYYWSILLADGRQTAAESFRVLAP